MFILGSRGLKSLWVLLFVAAIAWSQTAHPAPIRMAMIAGRSGPFANIGEAVYRSLLWAVELLLHAKCSVPPDPPIGNPDAKHH